MTEIKYFTLKELTSTSVKIQNIPEWKHLPNLERLAVFLDDIRTKFGKPIKINSAFRSVSVNAAVGGSSTSMHLLGLAADICASSLSESDNRKLLSLLEERIEDIDQLISYHTISGQQKSNIRFIHVGLCPDGFKNRKQNLVK